MLCRHILCQICDRIALGLEFTCIERNAARSLRPERQRMVDIVFVKTGRDNLFGSQIARELVDDRTDDFQVRKFFSTWIRSKMSRKGICVITTSALVQPQRV